MNEMINVKIKCPECGFQEIDDKTFINTEVGCSDCGSHSAIQCPKCEEKFDLVYHNICLECGLIYLASGGCPEHPIGVPA